VLLAAIGLGVYIYVDRYNGIDEADRSAR